MLILAWQYLTGRCVATDCTDRQRAEWPPHPDRVFQALVASWGERGEGEQEREALRWLEQQGYPTLIVPRVEDEPTPVKVYVPVNDTSAPGKMEKKEWKPYQVIRDTALHRDRKDRFFPYIRVGDGVCALLWEEDLPNQHRLAIDRICGGVTRIGHSSSLVRCWRAEDPHAAMAREAVMVYQPVRHGLLRREYVLRVAETGRLAALVEHRKAIVEGRRADTLPPRAGQVGYARISAADREMDQGCFSSPLLVFRQNGGSHLTLRQTLDVTQALRYALMSKCNVNHRLLPLVSGHAADGGPLRDKPHLAYLPLAFVGHAHAEGHLLGVAIALPRNLPPSVEDELYGAIAELIEDECRRTGDKDNECLRLVLGAKGEMCLVPEDRPNRRWSLRSETWCRPSCVWASVTPVVMDRMQNARRSDPAGWAADQVDCMCRRQGLPSPVQVLVRPVSFLAGAPPVRACAPMRRKSGASRRMVHVQLTFSTHVRGPLLLGSGRFKGYGVCRPMRKELDEEGFADALSLVNAKPDRSSTSDSESDRLATEARP